MSERISYFFFLKDVVMCSCRDGANTPLAFLFVFVFFLGSPLCRAGVSWRAADSQSWAQMLPGERGGRGERDVDGCYWNAFSCWPEKPDHVVCHREKCPHKNTSIWPINNTANVYLCVVGLSLGRSVCRWTHLFECRRHLFNWDLG